MRILGFSERWPKLRNPIFTTFRFSRKDKPWELREEVQIVFKPRTPDRLFLGTAIIVGKEQRWIDSGTAYRAEAPLVTDEEARRDGFTAREAMWRWLLKQHSTRIWHEPMDKLTLAWVKEEVNV